MEAIVNKETVDWMLAHNPHVRWCSEKTRMAKAEQTLLEVKRMMQSYDQRNKPRVGDFVIIDQKLGYTEPGTYRIAHVWVTDEKTGATSIQLGSVGQSYYLGRMHNGEAYISYSGGLEPGIPGHYFRLQPETREGIVWTFLDGNRKAHNSVYCRTLFKVYKLIL